MAVALHILGAGGSRPPPGYGGPSILVEAPDRLLLLDCGEGCLARLEAAGFGACEVSGVYVSHMHADHLAGLPSLATARQVEGCPSLRLYAAPEVAPGIGWARRFAPGSVAVEVEALRGPLPLGGGVELHAFPVRHPPPTFGASIRLGGEPLAAYTADTSYHPSLVAHLRGHEVVVADSTLPSTASGAELEYHMRVGDAWRLAVEEAGARLAVAFHLTPESAVEARRSGLPRLVVPGEPLTLRLH
ncbi:MAG: MBL fold metallo-hydrolase [Desulfurococcales archaeon]|nr:MBL fold metallo-hydrolase [Desulfurococcales archaeon]